MPDVLKKQKLHSTFWVASSSMDKTPRDYIKFKDSVSLKPYITTQFYKPSIYSKSFFFPENQLMIEFSAVLNWRVQIIFFKVPTQSKFDILGILFFPTVNAQTLTSSISAFSFVRFHSKVTEHVQYCSDRTYGPSTKTFFSDSENWQISQQTFVENRIVC